MSCSPTSTRSGRSRTDCNIDDSLIGGNASAEGPESEGTESTVITGVDTVMNHHLQETSFTKETYKKCIKDYMKSIKGKLEKQSKTFYDRGCRINQANFKHPC
uniref:TCTP domain-containing protein n=1 Tax=Cercocebus atys TaxID=9531 RepID=A0A2K5LDU9_CERAT